MGKFIELQEGAREALMTVEFFTILKIPIFTEKAEKRFPDASRKRNRRISRYLPVSSLSTPARPEMTRQGRRRALVFKKTMLVVHSIENPDFNNSDIHALDMAEAVEWWLPIKFMADMPGMHRPALEIERHREVEDAKLRVHAALFSLEAEITGPPTTPAPEHGRQTTFQHGRQTAPPVKKPTQQQPMKAN